LRVIARIKKSFANDKETKLNKVKEEFEEFKKSQEYIDWNEDY
jgi:hypothetical protein